VVHSTESACFHDHDGHNLTVRNNIFAMDGDVFFGPQDHDGALRSAAVANHGPVEWFAQFAFVGNIVYSGGKAPLFTPGTNLQWALSSFDENVYWHDKGRSRF
jgi:hypothetical protein